MKVAPWIGLLDRLDDEEELLAEAIDAIRGEKSISATFVQRELKIGYPRAARLVSLLESKGLVSAEGGRRPESEGNCQGGFGFRRGKRGA